MSLNRSTQKQGCKLFDKNAVTKDIQEPNPMRNRVSFPIGNKQCSGFTVCSNFIEHGYYK